MAQRSRGRKRHGRSDYICFDTTTRDASFVGAMRVFSRLRSLRLLLSAVVAVVAGCKKLAPSTPQRTGNEWFTDVTETCGARFVHDVGKTGTYFMPESIGSGLAIFDYDNDGRMDLFFVQNAGPESPTKTHRLFHQEESGHFTDTTSDSGIALPGWGMGVAVGDADNDGRPDLLITEYERIRFFHNDGAGKFSDATQSAGLENPHWGVSAAWFDYDRDNWLDLVVVNYVDYSPEMQCHDPQGRPAYCGPSGFPGTVSKLFHNRGMRDGHVQFEDVTVSSGLARLPGPGLGVVCADFDGDRWPDIFISNDGHANWLLLNQRDGTFREEGAVRGVAYNGMGVIEGNMGIAFGDVDGDGLFDLLSTHLNNETHTVWQQRPRGTFVDRTAASGMTASRWRGTGFGAVFADFNLDGAADLVIANGSIKRFASEPAPDGKANDDPFWAGYEQRTQLFANNGSGKFSDVSLENRAVCGTAAIARGVAVGDLDNDGAPDLVITRIAAAARIYRNIVERRGHWLGVRAVLPACGGRDALGAEITIVTDKNHQTGWVAPAHSYLCSNDPRALFAIGGGSTVDAIEVRWPDGTDETFGGVPIDRYVTLRCGDGVPKSAVSP